LGSLLLIDNLGYWEATIQTFSLVLFSTFDVRAVRRAHRHRRRASTLDLQFCIPSWISCRPCPTFVYLIPTLVLFGLGVVPGVISTVISRFPAPN